jgi:hypothetical protein
MLPAYLPACPSRHKNTSKMPPVANASAGICPEKKKARKKEEKEKNRIREEQEHIRRCAPG